MSKNNKIIVIVLAVVLIGGGIYFFSQNKDEDSTDNSSQTSQNTDSQNSSQQTSTSFSPLPTSGVSFVATITTTGGENPGTLVLEYDGKDSSKMTATTDGKKNEFYYTKELYVLCSESQCIKYPINQSSGSAYNPGDYSYDESEITSLKNNATYKGQESCPAGTCDVWTVTEDGNNYSIYVDSKTKRISQVQGTFEGVTTKIVYQYKPVTITVPANAQSIPSL